MEQNSEISLVRFKHLEKDLFPEIAELHIKSIPTGFISSLGQEFVATLYEAIAEDKNSFGFVAVENDKVLGFVAFTTNLSKLYKYVVLKKGFKFAFVLIQKMFSLKVFKKIWDNMVYPSKMAKMDLPDAELLSIVVAPQGRGKGIAKQLVGAGFQECRKRGIDKVKVLVAAQNEMANEHLCKEYGNNGLTFVRENFARNVLAMKYIDVLVNKVMAGEKQRQQNKYSTKQVLLN